MVSTLVTSLVNTYPHLSYKLGYRCENRKRGRIERPHGSLITCRRRRAGLPVFSRLTKMLTKSHRGDVQGSDQDECCCSKSKNGN